MTTDAPAPAPDSAWAMSSQQATAALAQKTAEYQAAQATAMGSVPPPPPGVPATSPEQARALLAARGADPQWRDKLLTGSAEQVREFQELTALAASGDLAPDHLIETVDAVSGDPNTLRRSHYEAAFDGLREGGMNQIKEDFLRRLDRGEAAIDWTQGDGLMAKQRADRLMQSPELRAKYLSKSNPRLTALLNNLWGIYALAPKDGRPISAAGRELQSELEEL